MTEKNLAEFKEALRLLKRGRCWCQMAIGHPLAHTHSEGCLLAQKLMGEIEKNG